MLKRLLIFTFFLSLSYSCIKPYACECDYVYTTPVQHSHILVYASKNNKNEACSKNNKDTSLVCRLKE